MVTTIIPCDAASARPAKRGSLPEPCVKPPPWIQNAIGIGRLLLPSRPPVPAAGLQMLRNRQSSAYVWSGDGLSSAVAWYHHAPV